MLTILVLYFVILAQVYGPIAAFWSSSSRAASATARCRCLSISAMAGGGGAPFYWSRNRARDRRLPPVPLLPYGGQPRLVSSCSLALYPRSTHQNQIWAKSGGGRRARPRPALGQSDRAVSPLERHAKEVHHPPGSVRRGMVEALATAFPMRFAPSMHRDLILHVSSGWPAGKSAAM